MLDTIKCVRDPIWQRVHDEIPYSSLSPFYRHPVYSPINNQCWHQLQGLAELQLEDTFND